MAAQIAINNFRTITNTPTTSDVQIYTAPTGYTSVFLLAQAINTGTITRKITFSYYDSTDTTTTPIVSEFPVPAGDTVNLLPGKLVLETGDKIAVSVDAGSDMKFLSSILETSNF